MSGQLFERLLIAHGNSKLIEFWIYYCRLSAIDPPAMCTRDLHVCSGA